MSDPFYCELLRANINNQALIQDFTIYREAEFSQLPDKIVGLEAYLKMCAWNDDADDLVKIYLIKDSKTDEVVAYFGLKASMLAANMEVGAKIGIHMIYLYAAGDDTLVSYYKDAFDFQVMTENDQYTPLEPEYDGGCTFMYQRFYSS